MDVKITFNDFTVTGANQLNNVTIKLLKGEKGDPGEPTDAQVTSAVNTWLAAHPEATTTVQDGAISYAKLDSTLKAKADDVDDLKSSIGQMKGFNAQTKEALLACFEGVAWLTSDSAVRIAQLRTALYPPVDLDYITAVYTQSGSVYNTDSLDVLRDDLVVTAYYDDGTSSTVTGYALSGTLSVGTSTVVVTYGDKTATFDVTVQNDSYIESDGNSYINIGYNPKATTIITLTYMNLKNVGDAAQCPLGYSNNATGIYTPTFYFYVGSSNTLGCSIAGSGGSGSSVAFSSPTIRYGEKNVYTLSASSFSVDGANLGIPYKSSDQQLSGNINHPLYAFGRNHLDTNALALSVGRIYDLVIYEGDTMVKHYIPSQKNGAYGLKEVLSGTFYGNSGSGTITGVV